MAQLLSAAGRLGEGQDDDLWGSSSDEEDDMPATAQAARAGRTMQLELESEPLETVAAGQAPTTALERSQAALVAGLSGSGLPEDALAADAGWEAEVAAVLAADSGVGKGAAEEISDKMEREGGQALTVSGGNGGRRSWAVTQRLSETEILRRENSFVPAHQWPFQLDAFQVRSQQSLNGAYQVDRGFYGMLATPTGKSYPVLCVWMCLHSARRSVTWKQATPYSWQLTLRLERPLWPNMQSACARST